MGRLALITLATGTAGRSLLRVTGPVLARYAERIGAEMRVIRGDAISPAYPMAAKFRLQHYAAIYDRIIYIDADCIVAPDCPDLFELVPANQFGVFNEGQHLSTDGKARTASEVAALAVSQGWPDIDPDRVPTINSGVMVFGQEHAAAFEPPAHAYPHTHCAEQYQISLNLYRADTLIYDLPESYNWQAWAHKGTHHTDRPQIAHYSGLGKSAGGPDEEARLRLVRERVELLYPGLLPEASLPCRHRGKRINDGRLRDWYTCKRTGFSRFGLEVAPCYCSDVDDNKKCLPEHCDGYAPGDN